MVACNCENLAKTCEDEKNKCASCCGFLSLIVGQMCGSNKDEDKKALARYVPTSG